MSKERRTLYEEISHLQYVMDMEGGGGEVGAFLANLPMFLDNIQQYIPHEETCNWKLYCGDVCNCKRYTWMVELCLADPYPGEVKKS